MAVTVITPVALTLNTFSANVALTAATAAVDGFTIDFEHPDNKIVIIATNTNAAAKTLIVKKGNGLQGVADADTVSIAQNETRTIVIESGRFKNVSGTNKGKVLLIPESTDVKIAAILLP